MKKKQKPNKELAATPVMGQPETAEELINKYGTYNIQPTSDSGNEFPTIAQGLLANPEKSMKKPPEA